MHFDLTVSLGNIVTLGTLLWAIVRTDRRLSRYDIEHETLMSWYCKAHNFKLRDLPTRSRDRGTL